MNISIVSCFVCSACSVNIGEFRGGQRNDMWLPLQNIKMGRLHLAITVIEDSEKVNLFLFLNTG